MANADARFVITAHDKASRVIRGVKQELAGVARTVAQFAGIAGPTAGLAGIGFALSGAVKEAEQAQRQLFKLEQLIKSTGGAAGITAQELNEFSRSLARSTLASTDGVRDAAGVLLTFRSISGDTFKETLSLAQDLAATMGGSLNSAVLQLGKALEDPATGLTALRRSGVSFTESERDLIRALQDSGKQLQAQSLILEKVRQQVGGTGAAEAGGLSGAVDTLSQNWSELLENIGNSGPIQAAERAINSLAKGFAAFNRQFFPSDQDRFYALADERAQLLDRLERSRSGQSRRQGNEIRERVAAIEAEMRAIQDRNIARIKEQGAAQKAADSFKQSQQAAAEQEKAAAAAAEREEARRRAIESAAEASRRAREAIESYVNDLKVQAETLGFTNQQLVDYELRQIGATQADVARAAALQSQIDAFEDARQAEQQLAEQRQRAAELIKDLDTGSGIRDQILEVQRLRDTFPELSDALAEVEFNLQEQWDRIGDSATGAAEDARDAWQDLGPTFASAFEDAIVSGKGLRDVMKGLEQDLIRIVTRNLVTQPLGNMISGLFTGGGTQGGSGIFNWLGGLFGGARAMGGPVLPGRAYLVGEEGPEIVVPRTAGTVIPNGAMGGGQTFNFTFALPADTVDYRRAGSQVAREAARQLRFATEGL